MIDPDEFKSFDDVQSFVETNGCPFVDKNSKGQVVTLSKTHMTFYNNDNELETTQGYKITTLVDETSVSYKCLYEDGKQSTWKEFR